MRLVPRRLLRSFGAKITLLATVTSGLAVLVVCAVLVIITNNDLRNETIAFAQTQARFAAINAEAPLAFEDAAAATEALQALHTVSGVARGLIHTAEGQVFAMYERSGVTAPRFGPQATGQFISGRWLVITVPVARESQALGTLRLVYDLSDVRAHLRNNIYLSLMVALIAMTMAWAVGRRIQRTLSRPVDELAETARRVSQSGDYSIRARKFGDDELGDFTEAFNEMLGQIQRQAAEIRAVHQQRADLLESERAARTQAEHASRMKDEFVATLSHELRTPLTAIVGWAGLLRKRAGDPNEWIYGLEVIERNGRMQAQIVEDLLDMSRIVSGKVLLNVQTINLVEVVEAALTTVRPAAEAKGVALQSLIGGRFEPVRGDAARLQQVAWNLLSNAIKFTPRGGRVQVELHRVASHLELAISDSGEGINPEFLPYVFDRFRQADSSTTRRHGGLGLGLAIVKQLVELHGGTVRATSPGRGEGATFSVELPVAPLQAASPSGQEHRLRVAPSSPGAPSAAAELDQLRVLVVDDDRDARELVARVLEDAGADVVCVASARDALSSLQSCRPHVMLSDIGMPGEDGYWLIEQVRGLPDVLLAKTPAAALTAFARSEDRTRALLAGYQMHVAKPVEPVELVAAVAKLRYIAEAHAT